MADAISLLRHVDGVLVTASVNSTRGPEASRLRDQLQGLDAQRPRRRGQRRLGPERLRGLRPRDGGLTASGNGDGHPGTPIAVRDSGEPPRGL